MYIKHYVLGSEMEPMALGSPPASPGTSPVINPNFLPAFLMGENQTSTPRTNSISPSKNRSVSFKSNTLVSEQRVGHQRFYPQAQEQPTSTFNLSAVSEKVGPPAKGLFDTIDTRNEFTSPVRQEARPSYLSPVRDAEQRASYSTPQRNPNFSRNLNESLNKSYRKQTTDSNSESLWVTVLGFPPHAASLVLSQFAQCGTIIDKKFPPEGNWVNLKYSNRHEVGKALSFNGKLISNSIMVGVLPYNNCENKENASNFNESLNMTSPNRARPLTQPFSVNPNTTEVLSPQNVPQKSTGLVTKAMEYVFGW